MPKKLTVVGNWKMQGSKSFVEDFVKNFQAFLEKKSESAHSFDCESAICPPYVYLSQCASLFGNIKSLTISLGAQDVSAHSEGAYTGQISASMLKDVGCRYVIVGHSERRQYNHENDSLIAEKFFVAKKAGLIPILCVGETAKERESNQTEKVIISQLSSILSKGGAKAFEGAMVAYEPVWAIGTGLSATPEDANAIHDLIRRQIGEYDPTLAKSTTVLYGGSVKAGNASALFSMPHIDGALVGGASLDAQAFGEICIAASKLKKTQG